MLNKLHVQEQQATHAQCLALLVEFTTAVRAQKVCLMCGAKIAGGSDAHTPECAIRRADAFVRTRIRDSARSGLIDGAAPFPAGPTPLSNKKAAARGESHNGFQD